jgi:MFS family permease
LIFCVLEPGLWPTVALWALSGLSAAYLVTAQATFVQDIPDAQRGQAIGLARTALIVSQGIGVLVAGAAADHWQPPLVVAAAGICGVAFASAAARGYQRAERAG